MLNKEPCAIGTFTDQVQVDQALAELEQVGFRPEQIQMLTHDQVQANNHTTHVPPELKAKGGAELGGILGGMLGCLLGVAAATGWLPGVHPIFEGGAVGAIVGAGVGILVGVILGALIGWGLMGDAFNFYVREMRAGETLIAVRGNRSASAADLLRRLGATRVVTSFRPSPSQPLQPRQARPLDHSHHV